LAALSGLDLAARLLFGGVRDYREDLSDILG
jgi:hypothetical protein